MTKSFFSELELYTLISDQVEMVPMPAKSAILADLYTGVPLGVYTMMRTYEHNKFLHLREHLIRLDKSMATLGWDFQLDIKALRHGLHKVCTEYGQEDARVRIDVLAKGESEAAAGSRVLISLQPFLPIPESVYQDGVRVNIEPALSRKQPEVKKAEFAVTRRKYLERDPFRYEYLMTDDDGHILEGTTSNFFGVLNGVLWTADRDVLEGIARMIILKLAEEAQIPVRLDSLKANDLPTISESALSSASRGLVPIVQIGDQMIGDGYPGQITRTLIRAYDGYVKRMITTAI